MSILNVCVEVIYHFAINCVLFAVFNTVLQRKMLKTEILASVLGAFMYVGLYYCNVYLPIIEIVNIIYLILFSYFVLKQTIAFHCLVCMFYNLCNNCFLLLIKSVLSSIENGQLFLDLLIESQVFKTIFLAIIIIVWYSFYVAFKSVLRDFVYNKNSMIAVFLLLFGGYAGYIYLIKMTYNAFSDEIPLKWFSLLVLMLLLFILVCLSSDIKTKKAKLFYEKKAKSLLEEKYDSISKVYSNNAKLYHDISNHLNILYQLLNDGLYVEAQAYIEKISEPTKLLTKRKWTGNQMIDAILNCKIEQMDELNIGYKVVSDFPIVARIENSDICIVLSNLLDNAVEAVSEMQNPDKIKIIIRTIKQFLYIQIENKCDCANKEIDGLPLSTKLDRENHGWGLQSVATIVEKYNGTYHYSVEDGVFIATVILFTEYKCT